MTDSSGLTSLEAEIVVEIEANGPMRFGTYMELALYHPTLGFYARGGAGRRRDFLTSAEVGPLFGAVVARALDFWWDQLGSPEGFSVVEVGAGPGTLARAVLGASPRCGPALQYRAVESSAEQRSLHPGGVESSALMPAVGGPGVVLANELCDNLAFDLYESDGSDWKEVRVGLGTSAEGHGRISEVLCSLGAAEAEVVLPPCERGSEGRRVRVPDQRSAREWLREALAVHDRGIVVVLDYCVDQYPVDPGRRWLRTYRAHDHGTDPLEHPGSQDITADVAIDQLSRVRAPDRVWLQADWLVHHGIEGLVEEGRRRWAANAAAPDVAALTARSRVSEAEALVDPAGLGGFRVLEWGVGPSTTLSEHGSP